MVVVNYVFGFKIGDFVGVHYFGVQCFKGVYVIVFKY